MGLVKVQASLFVSPGLQMPILNVNMNVQIFCLWISHLMSSCLAEVLTEKVCQAIPAINPMVCVFVCVVIIYQTYDASTSDMTPLSAIGFNVSINFYDGPAARCFSLYRVLIHLNPLFNYTNPIFYCRF